MNNTEPTLVKVDSFLVAGLSVRTINKDEFNPQTAKLGVLWGDFFSSGLAGTIPNRIAQQPVYGVYSDYAVDADDFYTVTAGVAVSAKPEGLELVSKIIQPGYYLKFTNQGAMPQAVIDTWKCIWTYFSDKSSYTRQYKTDFEAYLSAEEIAIYIGVLEAE